MKLQENFELIEEKNLFLKNEINEKLKQIDKMKSLLKQSSITINITEEDYCILQK